MYEEFWIPELYPYVTGEDTVTPELVTVGWYVMVDPVAYDEFCWIAELEDIVYT